MCVRERERSRGGGALIMAGVCETLANRAFVWEGCQMEQEVKDGGRRFFLLS